MSDKRAAPAASVREALAAQLLGELDEVVAKVEAATANAAQVEASLAETTKALTSAAEEFKAAAARYTDQAKADLEAFVKQRAALVVDESTKEQRAALDTIARDVFRNHSLDEVDKLATKLREAMRAAQPAKRPLSGVLGGVLGAALGAVLGVAAAVAFTSVILHAISP